MASDFVGPTVGRLTCRGGKELSINKASTGFSSLKKITSMMGAPCNTLFMRCLEYLADSDSDQYVSL